MSTKHVITVSKQNLTRCAGCGRHHELDRDLPEAELLKLDCQFCGERLIGSSRVKPARLSRSAKLAMGLLSASLTMAGCDDDDPIENPNNGGNAGVQVMPAGDDIGAPEYGAFPAGEEAGVEVTPAGTSLVTPMYGEFPAGVEAGSEAGVEMMTAGEPIDAPLYGEFPAGTEAGSEAGVEMMTAGDDIGAPEYGAFPAGEEAPEGGSTP